jgi:hypothetical protein
LEAILSDPSFAVHSLPSSNMMPFHNHPDLEMKKAFTEFHNASQFATDSTSAFFGGESASSFRQQDTYFSNYHLMMTTIGGGGGSSVPHHGKWRSSSLHIIVLDVKHWGSCVCGSFQERKPFLKPNRTHLFDSLSLFVL